MKYLTFMIAKHPSGYYELRVPGNEGAVHFMTLGSLIDWLLREVKA